MTRPDLWLAWRCLADRLKNHDNYAAAQHWWWRWGYAAKAAVCALAGRIRPEEPWKIGEPGHEHVDSVATWGHRSTDTEWGAGADWEEASVGHGVLRGWHVHTSSNGYP